MSSGSAPIGLRQLGAYGSMRAPLALLELPLFVLLPTFYGEHLGLDLAVIGAVLFMFAQNYLQDLLKLGSAFEGVPVLSQLVSPDRWLLWLGVLFVLSVYYFPAGVVGRLRMGAMKR